MDTPQVAAPSSGATTAPAEAVVASTEPAGQAAFNPFGTIGVVEQLPPPAPAAPQAGDWSLPVSATVGGFVFIGWMMRKMLN